MLETLFCSHALTNTSNHSFNRYYSKTHNWKYVYPFTHIYIYLLAHTLSHTYIHTLTPHSYIYIHTHTHRHTPMCWIGNLSKRPYFPHGYTKTPHITLRAEASVVDDFGCGPFDGKLCSLRWYIFIICNETVREEEREIGAHRETKTMMRKKRQW